MAVGKTPVAGSQQSISRFFTQQSVRPKLLSSSSAARPTPKDAQPPASRVNGEARPESDDSEDADTSSRRSSAKRTIESFQKDSSNNVAVSVRLPKRLRQSDQSHLSDDGPVPPARPSTSSAPVVQYPSDYSSRTARYLFSQVSTTDEAADEEPIDPEVLSRRTKLHQRFVKKLGKPDSIAEIKRRNRRLDAAADGEGAGGDDEDAQQHDDEDVFDEESGHRANKKSAPKKGLSKLTPMEKQVLDIKREHPDTLLVVEVGYKFRFFGEDARTAAKELSIVCIPGKFRYDEHPSETHIDRFASASIPVHRLHVHVRRLVQAGHKVGIVRQLETAALKAAGDNRNAPFVRKLTNLYTKGTYIDENGGLVDDGTSSSGSVTSTGYLLCITETKSHGWGTDERVNIGILAVQPQTGDILYDAFEDGFMRGEIDTRLLHISPCELLIVGDLSKQTEKVVRAVSTSNNNALGDKVRVERTEKPKTIAAEAYSFVSNFYAGRLDRSEEEDKSESADLLERVLKLPDQVTVCLSAMIKHLTAYGMENVFDLTKYFTPFSTRAHMLLNGNTLASLEIYRNSTDNSEVGSLFWILDRTKTRFGQRMLRRWVGRPLLDRGRLEERIGAIDELRSSGKAIMADKIEQLLNKIKIDLEKSLLRIYYGKATRPELLNVLQAFQRIGQEFLHSTSTFESSIVQQAISSLPTIAEPIGEALERINLHAAKADNKFDFFMPTYATDAIQAQKAGIIAVEEDLKAHRVEIAAQLKVNKVEFVTVAGIDYLIEVPNVSGLKLVPASWAKISGTKKVSRFHTPTVVALTKQRDQHRETLAAACDDAYRDFLTAISEHYQELRDVVQNLAQLDCLLSLAEIAAQPGYVKPEYTDEPCLEIIGGRHPMVEALLAASGSSSAYIPNDTHLSASGTRALLITGPNMGGKSSYVRHLALLAILAQLGSYVPATSAKVGVFDAIFTRMGAADNLMKGQSTFQVELAEMSTILRAATSKSLVLVDELGRGTSTHDGVAVAEAVLVELVERRCLTGFITHYQSLAKLAARIPSHALKNVHVKFEARHADDDAEAPPSSSQSPPAESITLLYEIGDGVAHRSYGLNVARIAGLPLPVLKRAKRKSEEMERRGRGRKLEAIVRTLLGESRARDEEESLRRVVDGIEAV